MCQEKDAEITSFLGGRPPPIFRLRGTSLPSPAFDAHVLTHVGMYIPMYVSERYKRNQTVDRLHVVKSYAVLGIE